MKTNRVCTNCQYISKDSYEYDEYSCECGIDLDTTRDKGEAFGCDYHHNTLNKMVINNKPYRNYWNGKVITLDNLVKWHLAEMVDDNNYRLNDNGIMWLSRQLNINIYKGK